ncbi:MAG TPA: glycosyltransferase family 2 protein [Mycobacterium sp.]|nr:glycosyltransferase family 2 protein [Mycobacterium sp.]HPZ94732.1 glycosyltransferase family 2 protein [Mycobacterium sp.]HQE15497.1 glycosyltransferase family 2 protein [Mycobacterium sp.]
MAPIAVRGRTAYRPRVTVVIPALNEERNLPHIAGRMPADVDEIVVVDGHSQDRTVEVARLLWPEAVVVQQTRSGKGNALACGFAAATGDIIVTLDADGSNDPAEIPDFVAALLAGADFVKGSRFMAGGGSSDITWCRWAGNWGLGAVYNALFGTRYTDLCYGYNAFWRHSLGAMALPPVSADSPQWGDGFEIEALINARVADAGLAVAEVCSFEGDRMFGASNLHAVRDGLRVLTTIVREYAGRRRVANAPAGHRHGGVLVGSLGVAVAAAAMVSDGDWKP